MRAVIIKLDRTNGKIGVQVVISAAAQHPACAGAAGAMIKAQMRNAQKSMDKNIEPVHMVRELRTEKDVVFAGLRAKRDW